MKSIDLFAGAGGMTSGAEQGGMQVVWAANHWDLAVQIHMLHHPECVTVQQDLQQANFGAVLGDAKVDRIDAIFAGPSCQGHSSAGQVAQTERARIKHNIDRATAFAVVTACEVLAPRWVVVENVPRWRKWKLFAGWLALLHALGYATDELTLCAHDYGVPQARSRLLPPREPARSPHSSTGLHSPRSSSAMSATVRRDCSVTTRPRMPATADARAAGPSSVPSTKRRSRACGAP